MPFIRWVSGKCSHTRVVLGRQSGQVAAAHCYADQNGNIAGFYIAVSNVVLALCLLHLPSRSRLGHEGVHALSPRLMNQRGV